MKKTISFILCVVLLLGLGSHAFAGDPALERDPVAFYQTDNGLCTFFSVKTKDATSMVVKKGMFDEESVTPNRISDGKTPVTYFILLDANWSMTYHRDELEQILGGLYNSSFDHTYTLMLPFYHGDYRTFRFDDMILSLGVSDLQNMVKNMSFYGQEDSPSPFVRSILEYLNTYYPVEVGGLVNVVLLSNKVDLMPDEGEDYKEIQKLLSGMPQLLFHTIQLGEAQKSLPDFGRGFHLQVDSNLTAGAAGNMINSYISNLESVLIPWKGTAQGEVRLYLQPAAKNPDGSNQFASRITLPWVPVVNPVHDKVEVTSTIPQNIKQYSAPAGQGFPWPAAADSAYGGIVSYSAETDAIGKHEIVPIDGTDPVISDSSAEGNSPSAPGAGNHAPVIIIPSGPPQEDTPAETAAPAKPDADGAEAATSEQDDAETESADPLSLQVASAYRTKDSAVLFLDIDCADEARKPEALLINGSPAKPEKLADMNGFEKATDVILIDLSGSMQDHADDVASFVRSLTVNGVRDTRFILATYRDHILFDDIVDTGLAFSQSEILAKINEALDSLAFSESEKNGQTGRCVLEMIDYIQQDFPAKPGSLVNLIVLSGETENLNEAVVQQALNTSPEILFHSVLFGKDSAMPLLAAGVQTAVNETRTADQAADEIGAMTNSLYRVGLPAAAETDERSSFSFRIGFDSEEKNESEKEVTVSDVALFVSDGKIVRIGNESASVMRLDAVESLFSGEEPSETASGAPAPDKEGMELSAVQAVPAAEPGGREDSETKDAAPAEETQAPAEESALPAPAAETQAPAPAAETQPAGILGGALNGVVQFPLKVVILIGIAFVVLLLRLLIALRSRREKVAQGPQVPMLLEVSHGECKKDGKVIVLTDQIIIGRDRKCDIVFNSPDVSRRNTRIFFKDGFIYIEDLNSANGTSLEGMRIYSRNRLRSGDQISIGSVSFCLKF